MRAATAADKAFDPAAHHGAVIGAAERAWLERHFLHYFSPDVFCKPSSERPELIFDNRAPLGEK